MIIIHLIGVFYLIITDTHTHSNVSPDGADSPEILSAAARQNSVDILCITDHFEVPEKDEDDYKNIAPKIAQTFSVRDSGTLVGIELGGAVYDYDFAKEFLNRFDFDFVLGSLHHLILNGAPIDYYFYDYTDCDTAKMLREYFAKLYANSLLFSILHNKACPNGDFRAGKDTFFIGITNPETPSFQ